MNDEKNVILLGPRNIDKGYLVESGFVTTDKNIDIPNSDTIWSIVGNNKLTINLQLNYLGQINKELLLKKKYL